MTEVTGKTRKSKAEVGRNKGEKEDISGNKEVECETCRVIKQEVGGLFFF